MADGDDWSVVFYIDENGESPVRAFLTELDAVTQRRFAWSIEQLRIRNIQARFPLVRPVEAQLWELREESSTNIFRIFYVFFTGKQIVLLHGFQKKSPKAPRREIDTALKRLRSWQERMGRS